MGVPKAGLAFAHKDTETDFQQRDRGEHKDTEKAENGFERKVTKEAKGEADLYRGKPQRAVPSSFG